LLQLADMKRMKLICDNQATLHISPIPIFMKKWTRRNCLPFHESERSSWEITIGFANSNDQLPNMFAKSLREPHIEYTCNKLGSYAPCAGRVCVCVNKTNSPLVHCFKVHMWIREALRCMERKKKVINELE